MTAPPPEVLAAYDVSASPEPLPGGQGRTWRAGDLVLKPVDDEAEHAWVCDVFARWTSTAVAVPLPVATPTGWSAHGWSAHRYAPGVSARAGDDPGWFRHVHEEFHRTVADLPAPPFLSERQDPWAYGDRVAWEGEAPKGASATLALLRHALGLTTPLDLPVQVVHGDLGGNVLRDGDRATVIDWPPYFRPVGWALAVVAADAVCWEDADPGLLDDWADVDRWDQLLVRAIVYRLATQARNEVLGTGPVGSADYVAHEGRILRLVEDRL